MMNPAMRYLESSEFRAGYNAAALGLPFDRLKPQAWRGQYELECLERAGYRILAILPV